MQKKIIQLPSAEALNLTLDALVVAIRWDVLPWDLVLDMDIPLSAQDKGSKRRAWLCFRGLSSFTWPFVNARLPTGCWLGSYIEQSSVDSQFTEYRFQALVPEFMNNGSVAENPMKKVVIRAQEILGLVSAGSIESSGIELTWENRTALASDHAFVKAALAGE